MNVLLYLLIPLAVIVVGSLVLTALNHKPQNMRSSMKSFEREMNALSPDNPERKRN
jgi:hypothetical protein